MYSYKEIKSVHIEISSHCNASCPMCSRNQNGGKTNPFLPLKNLNLEDIKKIFTSNFLRQLNSILFCGNFGDPIASPHCLDILKYIKSINPNVSLKLITNGSLKNSDWWTKVAVYTDEVCFSIDGLKDTNHIYRRGTNFDSIESNAKSFIEAGGNARWDYIVFKHNEHQVQEAETLSKKLGFNNFVIKKTGRFYSNQKNKTKESKPVLNKLGETEYFLEMPSNDSYKNDSLKKETRLVDEFGSLENYFNMTEISCRVHAEKNIYISSDGTVFPCCWTGAEIYKNWWLENADSQLKNFLKDSDVKLDSMNALIQNLDKIVNGPVFQKIFPSFWGRPPLSKRLKTCARICGSQFNQFKDQYE